MRLERSVFGWAQARQVVSTTPNVEYNALFAAWPTALSAAPDTRFEWTRGKLASWGRPGGRAQRETRLSWSGHSVLATGAGERTQLAIFRQAGAGRGSGGRDRGGRGGRRAMSQVRIPVASLSRADRHLRLGGEVGRSPPGHFRQTEAQIVLRLLPRGWSADDGTTRPLRPTHSTFLHVIAHRLADGRLQQVIEADQRASPPRRSARRPGRDAQKCCHAIVPRRPERTREARNAPEAKQLFGAQCCAAARHARRGLRGRATEGFHRVHVDRDAGDRRGVITAIADLNDPARRARAVRHRR